MGLIQETKETCLTHRLKDIKSVPKLQTVKDGNNGGVAPADSSRTRVSPVNDPGICGCISGRVPASDDLWFGEPPRRGANEDLNTRVSAIWHGGIRSNGNVPWISVFAPCPCAG